MDSTKSYSVKIPLQKSPIPTTFLKQHYSLPSPIIKYMLENSSAINYFKLFQTCKILQKFIQEKYGPQIDILEVGNFNNHYSCFISHQPRNNEIKIQDQRKNFYYQLPKDLKLCVRKQLVLNGLNRAFSKFYFERLNLSSIREVYILHTGVHICDYKKLLVPSIEVIYLNYLAAAEGFDTISYTLKHLPNLKSFKLPWNRNLTNFVELTSIKRDTKLQKAEIYAFFDEFDDNNLKGFIAEHMATGSTLCLRFAYSVLNLGHLFAKTVIKKYQKFAVEFNKISSAKIVFE